MLKTISTHLNHFAHLFFPHVCEGCGSDILPCENLICASCLLKLPVTGSFDLKDNPVEKIFYGRLKLETAGSAFYFTKHSLVQHLILQLKYFGNTDVGFFMGQLLGRQLAKSNRFQDVDVIIPLPLNARKEKKRGYNQAAIIADGIKAVWQKTVLENNVQRLVFTDTQTHKDRISRWQTMEGVFEVAEPFPLMNKHVLLVDDVVTTGATLEACGEKILRVKGTKLSIATVAYTI